MTAPRQTTATACNPVELWNALVPADQARLGALAIATELAIQGSQFNIDATREETTAITREMAVALFRQRWLDALARGPAAREALEQLRGKNLACYCPLPAPGQPDICHRSVLLELANAP
jgi:hypothetical protein